MVILLINL